MKIRMRWLLWVWPAVMLGLCSCDVHQKLAQMHFKHGIKKETDSDFAGAIAEFSNAISQDPKFTKAYEHRALNSLLMTNYLPALQDYQKLIELDPHNSSAYNKCAIVQQALKDFSGAMTNYSEAISLNPSNNVAYHGRGELWILQRDWDNAMKDFDAALRSKPDDGASLRERGDLELILRHYEAAIADATVAINIDDEDEIAYRVRGDAKMHLKDYTGALADFNKAVQLDSEDPNAFAGRAAVRVTQDDFAGAKTDLQWALQMSPSNTLALGNMAFLEKKTGDEAQALGMLKNLALLRQNSPEILQSIGCTEFDLGNYKAAKESFGEVIKKDGRMYYSHFFQWLARARLGEQEEASFELASYVKTNEGDAEHEWQWCIGRFLAGGTKEEDFLAEAPKTITRPTDESEHWCEAYYYSGMKRLINGDKAGANELLKKCIGTGEDNYVEYASAKAELKRMNP